MLNTQPFDEDDLQDLLNAALSTPPTHSSPSSSTPLSIVTPEYHPTVHDIPEDDRPRERLQKQGPDVLSTSDLLAVVLRTGTTRENVMELATKLLIKYGGLAGLMSADFHEISNEYGLGQAKTAQLKAALELGKRLSMLEIEKRYQIRSADDAARLVRMELMYLDHEDTPAVF
jgi:DNA repair protein RadC